MLYGPTGVGKTTAAAFLPGPLFIDLEEGSRKLNVSRATPKSWAELRGGLANIELDPPEGVRSIVIDSATVVQLLAADHVLVHKRTKEGMRVDTIEGFGWGAGWQYVSAEFDGFVSDLDRIRAKGLNVCIIAHEFATEVPNPGGEPYLRWEPHIFSGDKNGKGSIKARLNQWCDHLVFVNFDVSVERGSNRGVGAGTRTIYTQALPSHMAGSRTLQTSINYDLSNPGEIWTLLGIK